MNPFSYDGFLGTILPIVFMILVGSISRNYFLRDSAAWDALDRMSFTLLIPCLIVATLAKSNIYAISGWLVIGVILTATVVTILVLSITYWLFVPVRIIPSSFTSVFQTSTRWNASIAIVVVGFLFDQAAITVVALIMIALMPLVNVINIVMMIQVLDAEDATITGTLSKVLRNPIIISCILGITISASGIRLWDPIQIGLDTLGQASIGTILVGLGAGLSFKGVTGKTSLIVASSFLKLFMTPFLVFLIGLVFGLTQDLLIVVTIATSMPTATNGYVVAKAMGGDSPLYASICTIQTFFSMATIPFWIYVTPQLVEFFQR